MSGMSFKSSPTNATSFSSTSANLEQLLKVVYLILGSLPDKLDAETLGASCQRSATCVQR